MEKNLKSEFFFRIGRLNTLVLKNHFVYEVGCFLRASHIYFNNTCSVHSCTKTNALPLQGHHTMLPSARFLFVQVHIRGDNAGAFPT